MTPEQQARLQALTNPWSSYGLVQELYDLDLTRDEALLGALRSWAARRNKPAVEVVKPNLVHRHHLETFLQVMKLRPMKLAAAMLGMETASLRQVEEALKPQGFYVTSPLSEQLAEEPRLREITRFFSSLADRAFPDHDAFCRRLHEAIAQETGIQVRELRCVTSQALHEQPPQYAHEFDVLTLEPIGLKYQVWLDFSGKPAFLKPDCCATKTYAEDQALLGKYLLAGEQPELPSALAHV